MGGSELGDTDHLLMGDTHGNKPGQRISARPKAIVNYNNMVCGTGQFSDSMDYSEVGGPNARPSLQKKVSLGPKDVK